MTALAIAAAIGLMLAIRPALAHDSGGQKAAGVQTPPTSFQAADRPQAPRR